MLWGDVVSGESAVVTGRLRDGAASCRRLRERTDRLSFEVDSPTQDAAAAVAGWRFQSALQQLRMSWRDDFRRLCRRLDATGEALVNSAVRYERNEEATAEMFRAAEGPW